MSREHEHDSASSKKIEAIYSLRNAAEEKAQAEIKAQVLPTPAARDALLDAQLRLEAKTQDAIEACHECGRPHGAEEPHYTGNVRNVDFGGRHRSE
jgi:hypothetical protein